MASDIRLTADWVAAAMAGTIVASGGPDAGFSGVSIDTRTLRRGELYIGIRGDRFDGADFAAAAVKAGAAGVVVPRGRGSDPGLAGAAVIEVDETVAALQTLAHATRRASGTKVVAITGSAGKTTTKEVTAEFLGAKYRVIRNRGNLNNHIGLPLSLMELTTRPDVAVVELGMNHAGEISTLVRIAEPDVRVWTNVGEAHLGFFASIDAIADAKSEILEGAAPDAVLVANADDDRVMARARSFAGRVVTFGIDRPADVRAARVVDRGIDGTAATVNTPGGSFDLRTPLIGQGNLANILAATAVGVQFEVPLAVMASRAATLTPAHHRGDVVRLGRGVVVIDDSYNANPTATRRAIDVVRTSAARGRRVAVLGEMLELGDRAAALHEDVGRAAAAATLDELVAIGGDPARAMAAAAVAAGMNPTHVRHFATSEHAADAIASYVNDGDLVLVKGSRGIRTDLIVERLKAEFA
ncbi:MAG TPA: UDP-N-acetylmuramoyl-tripeptide--D-alanyl-D-alanine ligase [Vicinamibacterales bacterium]|nr:UDP-N-acetylmuramoyl-tripeptide--D-alanyl-D-alanine ligase [Vicinamibacterales bacterium]